MSTRCRATILLSLVVFTVGCKGLEPSRLGSPPPGWRSPVNALLLDASSFPEGWQIALKFPEKLFTDPATNHVSLEWWNPEKGSAGIMQSIWRSYTIEDAIEQYNELRQNPVLLAKFTPSPDDFYVEFRPPSELNFQSSVANEFYMACGWIVWSYCEIVARYRNYVVDLRVDLEAEYDGRNRQGLTYPEIEVVIEAMDAKFAEFLRAFPSATSFP